MRDRWKCVRCAYDMDGYCRVLRKHTGDDGGKGCGLWITPAQLRNRRKAKERRRASK